MTRYAVVRETDGQSVVCHFGPVRDLASRMEALLAMLSYTPATPEYNVIPVAETTGGGVVMVIFTGVAVAALVIGLPHLLVYGWPEWATGPGLKA